MRVAVVGGGVVGLAVTASLLQGGDCEVRCFEPGEPMKQRSVGESRIFRTTHADARLVGAAMDSLAYWARWDELAGKPLINRRGLVYNGDDARQRAKTMSDLGIPNEMIDGAVYLRDLTTHNFARPSLLDPHAGVIDVNATRRLLEAMTSDSLCREAVIDLDTSGDAIGVVTSQQRWTADSVVIVAGQATSDLARLAGIEIDITHVHVARFAFRSRNRFAMPPCWFDSFDGIDMWGQPVQPGVFALGVHWSGEPTSLNVSAIDATHAQLNMAHRYLSVRADRLSPGPIQTIARTADAGGDAMFAAREGGVVAFWGDNLFKFAPLIGPRLADAAIEFGLPDLPLDLPA